ncbi:MULTISPECIES: hypothetical protein [Actinomadura]|uniref:hypothetical protein n=1 Tax=Actinomadura TaxID=1988 RepID=UPI001BE40368|nr:MULTISPECIES: hypothetical protein [Actinomadura]MBT2209140.1 hypothetical protein [Actinomadura sp. NEAU-AAG7]
MTDTALDRLEALREDVTSRGLTAKIIQPRDRPMFLRVVNMDAGQLAENVTVGPYGGEPCFLYSWGAVICPVRLVASAGERLSFLLSPKPAGRK